LIRLGRIFTGSIELWALKRWTDDREL